MACTCFETRLVLVEGLDRVFLAIAARGVLRLGVVVSQTHS